MRTILVIDDEEVLRTTVEAILSGTGRYSVTTAADGKAGLKAAEKKPDLILLDIDMPKLNGLEVLGKLKERSKTREIPVIMLTGVDTEEALVRAMENQAEQYIRKPFTASALLEAVERALAFRRRRF